MKITKVMKLAVLRRMRTKVRKGWIKRSYDGFTDSGKPGVCVLGAMRASLRELYPELVINGYGEDQFAEKLSLTKAASDRGFTAVYRWNDHPNTRKADVLRLLDEKIGELT